MAPRSRIRSVDLEKSLDSSDKQRNFSLSETTGVYSRTAFQSPIPIKLMGFPARARIARNEPTRKVVRGGVEAFHALDRSRRFHLLKLLTTSRVRENTGAGNSFPLSLRLARNLGFSWPGHFGPRLSARFLELRESTTDINYPVAKSPGKWMVADREIYELAADKPVYLGRARIGAVCQKSRCYRVIATTRELRRPTVTLAAGERIYEPTKR